MTTSYIPFHKPTLLGTEDQYLNEFLDQSRSGESSLFVSRCIKALFEHTGCPNIILTSSCTAALEAALMALDLRSDDEVIVPAYSYMSAPNSVLRAGANVVFGDIDSATMNLSLDALKRSITSKTKAVIYIHYGGLSHRFDPVVDFCRENGLTLIEDAAHSVDVKTDGHSHGVRGAFGAFSFHATKNIHCWEGGALLVNDPSYVTTIDEIVEKGTDRLAMIRGQRSFYEWQRIGSSFTMSPMSAAFLFAQLKGMRKVHQKRKIDWLSYYDQLSPLQGSSLISLPDPSSIQAGNGHIFYIKTDQRSELQKFLSDRQISSAIHYPALNNSPAAARLKLSADCPTAEISSQQLLRLPLFHDISEAEIGRVCRAVQDFFS